jgi:hypothetical protein
MLERLSKQTTTNKHKQAQTIREPLIRNPNYLKTKNSCDYLSSVLVYIIFICSFNRLKRSFISS